MGVEIICGEAREVLAGLPAASAHACITSPPYFGLRSYGGGPREIGTESTPQEFVAHLVEVFRAVWRVLRDDGTCWIVIGDSFASSSSYNTTNSLHTVAGWKQDGPRRPNVRATANGAGVPAKNLLMIPHRVALALQDAGWYVRQEIVWSKPAPMPESVQDRCTRSHETVFMLAKQVRYFYDADAIREPALWTRENNPAWQTQRAATNGKKGAGNRNAADGGFTAWTPEQGRNKRSVWTINPEPLDMPHYAAFPQALVTPMILAGTSEAGCCQRCGAPYRRVVERTAQDSRRVIRTRNVGGRTDGFTRTKAAGGLPPVDVQTTGWVPGCSCQAGPPIPCTTLDPFLGSGSTALVSKRLGRSCVGIELNPAYAEMARRRVESVPHTLFSAAVLADDGAAAR